LYLKWEGESGKTWLPFVFVKADIMSTTPPPKLWFRLPPALWALLGLFALLVLAYNVIFPPFEPVDEWAHFDYIRFLIEQHRFPVGTPDGHSEYHQPPLYYALAAALSWPFPATDRADYTSRANPYRAYRYWEPGLDNKNLFIHGHWDLWPFPSPTARSVHVARLVSLLVGLGTVCLTFQMSRWLVAEPVALAVTGLTAFLPMFLAVSGSLQNDAGAAFAGTCILWLGIVCYANGFTTRRALSLGALVGLGALMKVTVAFLLAPAVLAVFTAGLTDLAELTNQRLKRRLGHLGWLLLAAAVTAGPWYLRNQLLYGDPTAVKISRQASQSVVEGVGMWSASLKYAWSTFWGRFGQGDVVLPQVIYDTLAVITLLAAVGLTLKLARCVHRRWLSPATRQPASCRTFQPLWPFVFLALAGLVEFLELLGYLTINPSGYMGRYTFPALSAYMLFLMLGLLELAPQRARRAVTAALPIGMLGFGLVLLPAYLIPVYTPSPAVAALPPQATPLNAQFGDVAILKGYTLSTVEAQPGDRVYVTLYWQPLRRTDQPYSTYLHLLDRDGLLVTQRDTYPGLGRNATNAWTPGQMFEDHYLIVIPDTAYTPVDAHWESGLWQKETGERAFVLGANGQPIAADAILGPLAIRPRPGQLPNPVDVNFGNQASLMGYQLNPRVLTPGQSFDLTVYWKMAKLEGGSKVEASVMTDNGPAWAEGSQVISDTAQTLHMSLAPDTPPGLYDLWLNVSQGQDTLPMIAADGHKLEDMLRLTGVKVAAP
jgi:4-amino-4-deoxy-L-arabinose transferase-like glycosyltransferase